MYPTSLWNLKQLRKRNMSFHFLTLHPTLSVYQITFCKCSWNFPRNNINESCVTTPSKWPKSPIWPRLTNTQRGKQEENTERETPEFKLASLSGLLGLFMTAQWGSCALHHWIQSSMEAILACHPAVSTEWLDWVAISRILWRMRTRLPLCFVNHSCTIGVKLREMT